MQAFIRSFVIYDCVSFMSGPELLKLQQVNRVFYQKIVPEFLLNHQDHEHNRLINHTDRFGSNIMINTTTIRSLKQLLRGQKIEKNLWRGSRDGFGSRVFHDLCDEKGKTLTLIRTTRGGVFGGYTDIPWSSNLGEPYVPLSGHFALSSSSFLILVDD